MNTKIIGNQQTNIISFVKNYIFRCKKIGVDVAVVDVNDLGKVKILASSNGTDLFLVSKALEANPAGNADQHTPIVIVRPC